MNVNAYRLSVLLFLVLVGCTANTKTVQSDIPAIIDRENKQNLSQNNSAENEKFKNETDGEDSNSTWHIVSRRRYIQGTITSLTNSSDGKILLNLKVEINYHSKTDPIGNDDFPFKIGQNVEFVLKEQPKTDLQKIKKVIVYEGQVTSNGKDSFLGAVIKYYEVDGKFYDMSGNQISLPPEDYPNSW